MQGHLQGESQVRTFCEPIVPPYQLSSPHSAALPMLSIDSTSILSHSNSVPSSQYPPTHRYLSHTSTQDSPEPHDSSRSQRTMASPVPAPPARSQDPPCPRVMPAAHSSRMQTLTLTHATLHLSAGHIRLPCPTTTSTA